MYPFYKIYLDSSFSFLFLGRYSDVAPRLETSLLLAILLNLDNKEGSKDLALALVRFINKPKVVVNRFFAKAGHYTKLRRINAIEWLLIQS